MLLTHFTEETCRSYQYDLAGRELKSGTIRVRVATLGSFGKWMVRRDKLVRNPVDRLTRPRRKARVPAVPTWDTVKTLLRLCGLRERAILALMAYGGLRRGEAAALDIGDVAPDFGLCRVMGKGGHEVPMALPAPARAILSDYMATERAGLPPTAPLFAVTYKNRMGQRIERRITGQRIWKIIKAVGARAGIPALHPHALRHACGAELTASDEEPASRAGTVAPRRRSDDHGLYQTHAAGRSAGVGNARRRGGVEEGFTSLPPGE